MLNQLIKKILQEATSDSSGGRGSYVAPLQPGMRKFNKNQLTPFEIPVSNYDSPLLDYDSYDGKMSTPKKQIQKIENKAKKITNYIKKHPNSTFSDDEGNVINPTPTKKINESGGGSGEYTGPIELGLKKWSKSEVAPFTEFIENKMNDDAIKKSLKNNLKKVVGMWEKGKDGTYDREIHDVRTIKEDLGVWFGTKKKPKGSKQPKGPWVNICRKKEGGGHPPCGRSDTDKGAYPKCRASGVASKMTDSQKRSACQQKRNAEKKDTQTGKGQKPVMTSYKTKKESVDSLVDKILTEIRNSF